MRMVVKAAAGFWMLNRANSFCQASLLGAKMVLQKAKERGGSAAASCQWCELTEAEAGHRRRW